MRPTLQDSEPGPSGAWPRTGRAGARTAATAVIIASWACGATDGPLGASVDTDPDAWSDVAALVERDCTPCHHDGGVAGFSLQRWADARPWAAAIADAVSTRRMPPWPAVEADVGYRGSRRLPQDAIDRLVAWADAGGPPWGDPARDLRVTPARALSRVDISLPMADPYAPGALTPGSPDDIRCFLVAPETVIDGFVVEGTMVPGNPAVVHHANTVALPREDLDALRALEAADPEPGWDCNAAQPGTHGTLTTYLPGQDPLRMPPGTGLAVRDPVLVFVVHYFEPLYTGSDAYPDRTAVHLMLEPYVAEPAEYISLHDPSWKSGVLIPAGETHAVSVGTWGYPKAIRELDEVVPSADGLLVHSVFLHMHGRGAGGRIELVRAGALDAPLILLDIDRWSFAWQLDYTLLEPIPLGPGDGIRVTCEHASDGTTDVHWGKGTDDEMCNARFLVTAR